MAFAHVQEPAAAAAAPGGMLPACVSFEEGVKIMLVMVLPFAVLFMGLTLVLSKRLEQGRRQAAKIMDDKELGCQKGQAEAAGDGGAAPDRAVPRVVLWFMAPGSLLTSINFTIMLPASAKTMEEAGGNIALSGLAIGAYALGAALSLPIMVYFSRHSYRAGILFTSAMIVAGNLIYAPMGLLHGPGAVAGLILARVVCGLATGFMVVYSNAILQLGSGAPVASAMAKVLCAGALGLVLGPGLASLSLTLFPSLPPTIPPAALLIFLSVLYAACGALLFPRQDDLFRSVGVEDYRSATVGESKAVHADADVRASWLFFCVMGTLEMARFFQRICWEAGFLLVLVSEYGYTKEQAGLLVMLPVLGSVPFIVGAGKYIKRFGSPTSCARTLGLLELAGLLMMIRIGSPGYGQLILFMVGSWVFYSVNWASTVPFAPLRPRFALNGHWALNLENFTSALMLVGFSGYFYGPLVSRTVLGACSSQNLLVATCVAWWAGAFLAVELGLHVLLGLPKQRKEEPAGVGSAGAAAQLPDSGLPRGLPPSSSTLCPSPSVRSQPSSASSTEALSPCHAVRSQPSSASTEALSPCHAV